MTDKFMRISSQATNNMVAIEALMEFSGLLTKEMSETQQW
jgi:hypothetical protein